MVHLKCIKKPLCWGNFRSSSGSETTQKCPLSILSRRTRSYTSFLVWAVFVLPLQIQEDLVAGYIQIQDWAVLGMVHSRRVRAPHYSLRRQQKTERGEIAFHCHLNQQFVWNIYSVFDLNYHPTPMGGWCVYIKDDISFMLSNRRPRTVFIRYKRRHSGLYVHSPRKINHCQSKKRVTHFKPLYMASHLGVEPLYMA